MLETYSKIIVKITFRLCQLKLSPTLEYLKCNYIIKYIQSFVIMPLNSLKKKNFFHPFYSLFSI